MKHVLLVLAFASCVGCSSVQYTAAKGAALLAVGVALQTDVAGKDSPKTSNYRDVTGIINMLGNDWRRNARLLTNR